MSRIVRTKQAGDAWATTVEPEGGGDAPGTVVPVGDPTGATVDTTTYDNAVTGTGKYTTLVVPENTGVVAIAVEGDTYPRIVITPGEAALWLGDGETADPTNMAAVCAVDPNPDLSVEGRHFVGIDRNLRVRNTNVFFVDPIGNSLGGVEGDWAFIPTAGPGPKIYQCTASGAGGVAVWTAILTV